MMRPWLSASGRHGSIVKIGDMGDVIMWPSDGTDATETFLVREHTQNGRDQNTMATKRTKTLQKKLDGMLAKCIEDIRSLGYEPSGDILPHVRLTTNSRGLGKCQEMTRSLRRVKRGVYEVIPGHRPVFEISCSVNAGTSDGEFRDVLYHEVIHTLPGCFSHGRAFKIVADHVNRAFGANVETKKSAGTDSSGRILVGTMRVTHDEAKEHASKLIGRVFRINGTRYKLTGMNPRAPKNSCKLVNLTTGGTASAPPEYLLLLMQDGNIEQ